MMFLLTWETLVGARLTQIVAAEKAVAKVGHVVVGYCHSRAPYFAIESD